MRLGNGGAGSAPLCMTKQAKAATYSSYQRESRRTDGWRGRELGRAALSIVLSGKTADAEPPLSRCAFEIQEASEWDQLSARRTKRCFKRTEACVRGGGEKRFHICGRRQTLGDRSAKLEVIASSRKRPDAVSQSAETSRGSRGRGAAPYAR